MKIETLPSEFVAAQPVLQRLEAAGFEAYFVGGAVRDMLLQKPIHDVDIASAAFPEEVKKQFDKTVDTGIQHGPVMVSWAGLRNYDVSDGIDLYRFSPTGYGYVCAQFIRRFATP